MILLSHFITETFYQGSPLLSRGKGDEGRRVHTQVIQRYDDTPKKEREQPEVISTLEKDSEKQKAPEHPLDRDFEGGFGGQEGLEDRFATTCGEH